MGTQGNCFSSPGSNEKEDVKPPGENAKQQEEVEAAKGMTSMSSNEPTRRKRKKQFITDCTIQP